MCRIALFSLQTIEARRSVGVEASVSAVVAESPNDSNAVIVIFPHSLTQYFNCLKKKHMYTVVVKQNEMEPAKDNETSQIIRFTGKLIVAGKSQKL